MNIPLQMWIHIYRRYECPFTQDMNTQLKRIQTLLFVGSMSSQLQQVWTPLCNKYGHIAVVCMNNHILKQVGVLQCVCGVHVSNLQISFTCFFLCSNFNLHVPNSRVRALGMYNIRHSSSSQIFFYLIMDVHAYYYETFIL
jgi:hypothetical protein